MILNAVDYEAKINNLLDDTTTYERLKRDPSSGYKKVVIDGLQKLEKEGGYRQASVLQTVPR